MMGDLLTFKENIRGQCLYAFVYIPPDQEKFPEKEVNEYFRTNQWVVDCSLISSSISRARNQNEYTTWPKWILLCRSASEASGVLKNQEGPQNGIVYASCRTSCEIPDAWQKHQHQLQMPGASSGYHASDSGFEASFSSQSGSFSQGDAEKESRVVPGKIHVSEIPSDVSSDLLINYFERSGGGDVESIDYEKKRSWAIIEFKNDSVVEKVLNKYPHVLMKQEITVERYIPSNSSTQEEQCLMIKVSNIPAGASEDLLIHYFENTRKSGGEEVKGMNYDVDSRVAVIEFEHNEVVERVLQKSPHELMKQEITIEKYTPPTQEEQCPIIKVSNIPTGAPEDLLVNYFENTKKSGGDEVIDIKYDVDSRVAVVQFKDNEVVEKVLKKVPHALMNQEVTVERYIPSTSSSQEEQHPMIIVSNIPAGAPEDLLINYFENTRKSGGDEVLHINYDVNNRKAVIEFEKNEVVENVLEKCPHVLMKQELSVEKYTPPLQKEQSSKIKVSNIPAGAPEDSLVNYFENTKKSGGDEVVGIFYDVDSRMAVIAFKDYEVVDRLLQTDKHMLNNQEITVEKYISESLPSAQALSVPMIRVAGIAPGVTADAIENFFENKKKSGGEDVKDVEFDEDKGIAFVTFEEMETVKRVLAKCPLSLNNKILDITKYTPDDDDDGSASASAVTNLCTLEVQGMAPGTSKNHITNYFLTKKACGYRLNDGDVSFNFDDYESKNVVYITFPDSKDAEAAATRSHQVNGENLQVNIYTPPAPPKERPLYYDRVFVTNVNECTTLDRLRNFLELNAQTYVENSYPGKNTGTYIVEFEKEPNFNNLIKKCKMKSLDGNYIQTKRIPISNCILVWGADKCTTKDTIKGYFDNKWRSGAEGVEKVEKPENYDCFLVYYEDYTVLKDVLSRKHTIEGKDVNARIYHDIEGISEEEGGIVFKIPDPIIIQDMDVQKLMFIKQSQMHLKAIEVQLQKQHAVLHLPDNNDAPIRIACSLTPETDNWRNILKVWRKSTRESFHKYMNMLDTRTFPVLQDLWQEVIDKIIGSNLQNESVLIVDNVAKNSLDLVGITKSLDNVATQIEQIIKDIKEDYERKKKQDYITMNTIMEQSQSLSEGQANLISKHGSGRLANIQAELRADKVEINLQSDKIIIKGTDVGLGKAQKKIEELLSSIVKEDHSLHMLGISQVMESDDIKSKIEKTENRHQVYVIDKSSGSDDDDNKREDFGSSSANLKGKQSDPTFTAKAPSQKIRDDIMYAGMINDIKVKLYYGDLLNVGVQAIVHSTNDRFDLRLGVISKQIAQIGGKALEDEVKLRYHDMQSNGVVFTRVDTNTKVCFKFIAHVNLDFFGDSLSKTVCRLLEKAEEIGITTIAMPLLGCRHSWSSRKPKEFVKGLNKGIMQVKLKKKSLKEIHIVIHDASKLHEIAQVMIPAEQSMIGRFLSFFGYFEESKPGMIDMKASLMTSTPCYDIEVFGFSKVAVKNAILDLENILDQTMETRRIHDDIIKNLSDKQLQKMKEIDLEYVEITIHKEEGDVVVKGFSESIEVAMGKIHQFLKEALIEKQISQKSKLVNNYIQWSFIDTEDGKEVMEPYPELINFKLEEAFCNQEEEVVFADNKGDQYIVDLTTMEEYAKDDHNSVVKVIRRQKIQGGYEETPANWSQMKAGENLTVITLANTDAEYQTVEKNFQSSIGTIKKTVVEIERIQNKALYQQYATKRKLMESQNQPGTQNERTLWHGTDGKAVHSINAHGFNRSYCGKNAVAYGDGVYFAVNSQYSAQGNYAVKDASGVQQMYQSKVLTGVFCKGARGMRVPPPKATGSHIIYDSVVDNEATPNMFVIFHDTQAYPEYLISFKA